jgi:hypothetical protein
MHCFWQESLYNTVYLLWKILAFTEVEITGLTNNFPLLFLQKDPSWQVRSIFGSTKPRVLSNFA